MKLVLFSILLLLLSGCALDRVSPWEREKLAEQRLQNGLGEGSLNVYKEHIYFSKEGSNGGGSVLGGGCGCN